MNFCKKRAGALLLSAALLTASCAPAYAATYAILDYGNTGTDVTAMQTALTLLGYNTNGIDGKFGPGTLEALKAFQSANGLKVDGRAGNETLTRLYTLSGTASGSTSGTTTPAAPTSTYTSGTNVYDLTLLTRPIRADYQGKDVETVQRRLVEIGYMTVVNSVCDQTMRTAVAAFQSRNGLTADGTAGNDSFKVLFSDKAIKASDTSVSSNYFVSGSNTYDLALLIRPIRSGYTGADVNTVQRRLVELGYLPSASSTCDQAMMNAVAAFQTRNNLTSDGKAGNATFSVLFSTQAVRADASTAPGSSDNTFTSGSNVYDLSVLTRPIRSGYNGTDVTTVQRRLVELGYLTAASGTCDNATLAAVAAFQSRNSLTADGVAGTSTFARMFSIVAIRADTSAAGNTFTSGGTTYDLSVLTRTIRADNTGNDVTTVQLRLVELGYLASATSSCDSAMRTAVAAFQTRNGLKADGLAGASTFKKMFNASAVKADVTAPSTNTFTSGINVYDLSLLTRVIRSGNIGADVATVQRRLVELGYLATATSTCDSAMTDAVKKFQTRNGLASDGKAGSNTFAKLFTVSAVPAATSTGSATVPTYYQKLKIGSTGADVFALTTYLANLDYPVTVCSIYTSETALAVKYFQSRNGLSVDGVAGPLTQAKLYTGSPNKYVAYSGGSVTVPSVGEIKLLHWFTEVKPQISTGQTILIYDPATGISFNLYLMSLGRHADVEPLTAQDTALMMEAFGGKVIWEPVKFVYVRLPSGTWTVATMHDVAHGSQTIKDNNFEGQNCVHFLRDMDEVSKNDPKYGVTNQIALRAGWLALTGETVE